MDISQKLVWNLYSAAIGALAALVTKKAVDGAWAFVTGEEPPEPNDPSVPTAKAAAWVMSVAVGLGLSQVLTNRFAASRWKAFTGATSPIRNVHVRF
ncbi:MAG: DUF4235 domain-containing protein [Actinomycetes bacterium]